MLLVRKVELRDKDEIIRISSKIWEGDDYISFVFEDWVNDPHGLFTAVIYEDKIVGFGRLVYLSPTDVWLEGLRRDPDVTIKGVGKTLSEHYLKILQNKKLTSIRFSTYYENIASITIAEKLGFRAAKRMTIRSFDLPDENEQEMKELRELDFDVSAMQPAESLQKVCSYIEESPFYRMSDNYFCIGWVCYSYSRAIIDKYFLACKQYLISYEGNEINGLLLYDMMHSTNAHVVCNIAFLSAENEKIIAGLLHSIKILAAKNNHKTIDIKLPTDDKKLLNSLEKAGFESWGKDDDFIVYEFPLNSSNANQ